MHPPASFVPFIMHLRILSSLFFLSALHRFRLPVAFPTPHILLSDPADLPLSPCLVSHTVLPVLLIQLAVRFLSSYPASLPQPFHRCSLLSPSSPPVPSCVCPCRSLPFVHVRFRASTTQPLFLPFPSSRFPVTVGTPVPFFPLVLSPVAMRKFPTLVLSFPAIPFPAIEVSPHRCYFFRRPSTPGFLLLSSAARLGFRFRLRYSSSGDTP